MNIKSIIANQEALNSNAILRGRIYRQIDSK